MNIYIGDKLVCEIKSCFYGLSDCHRREIIRRVETFFGYNSFSFESYNIAEDKEVFIHFTNEYVFLQDKTKIQGLILDALFREI
jgi:hypothetical protein